MRDIISLIFAGFATVLLFFMGGNNFPSGDISELLRDGCEQVFEAIPETTEAETTEAETETEAQMPPLAATRLFTDEERHLVALTAYLEARGSGVEGMALVVNVIVNRMEKYNLTATEVIYAPRQFAVVNTDGWYAGVYSQEAMQAVELVENGWDASQGACYFCTPAANKWHRSALTYLFTYKGTEFYK